MFLVYAEDFGIRRMFFVWLFVKKRSENVLNFSTFDWTKQMFDDVHDDSHKALVIDMFGVCIARISR